MMAPMYLALLYPWAFNSILIVYRSGTSTVWTIHKADRRNGTRCSGSNPLSVNAKRSTIRCCILCLDSYFFSNYAVDEYYRNALRISAPKKPGAPRPPRQTQMYPFITLFYSDLDCCVDMISNFSPPACMS